jgi:hypothetical protein
MRFVDRRAFPRQTVSQAAILTLADETKIPVGIIEISSRGLRVELEQRLEVDTPVRLALEEQVVLGRVCYCAGDESAGRYLAGLYLEHTLDDVEDLAKLSRMLAGEDSYNRIA